jgi:hypothetical protein
MNISQLMYISAGTATEAAPVNANHCCGHDMAFYPDQSGSAETNMAAKLVKADTVLQKRHMSTAWHTAAAAITSGS